LKKRISIYFGLLLLIAFTVFAGSRYNFIKHSFNAGEFSPSIYGRTDLEKYNNGCITMKNFIPIPQGGATRRPGFEYIASAKNAGDKVRLIPFQFSDEQSYIVECGADYLRYYMNGGQILTPDASTALLLHMNGDDASTTFTDKGSTGHTVTANGDAQIDTAYKKIGTGSGLFDGTGDYLSIPDHADWNFGSDPFTIDFWVRLSSDTSCNIFGQYVDSTHRMVFLYDAAGNSLYFDVLPAAVSLDMTRDWTPNIGQFYHIAVIRGWSGNANSLAICVDGVILGTSKNVAGITFPDYAASFEIGDLNGSSYVNGHIDEFRISKGVARWTTNFTPPTRAYPLDTTDGAIAEDTSTGYLESELDSLKWAQSYDTLYLVHRDHSPEKLTRADHDDWTLAEVSFTARPSDWTNANGYPQAVTFHQDRLVFAGSPAYPPRFWFSKTSDYENMTTGTSDDDGFTITLLSGSVDMIYWLESQRRLVAGSNSGEWWLSGDGIDLIITPTSKQAQNDTKYGSIDHQPVNIGNTIIMVQSPGTKIREMVYDYDTDAYNSNDITILADHILKGYSVKQLAYQQAPYQIVWVLRSDGTLFALTYMKEHEVVGWSEIETDGTVISIATIPGDPEDELWIAVNRDINGSTATYIERLKDFAFSNLEDAFMVDSGLTYDGASTTSITGLSHLEGETVDVLADGLVESHTVSSGAITLDTSASTVQIGMPYNSDLQTMYVDIPLETGSSMFMKKRIPTVDFRVRDSAGGKYGKDSSHLVTLMPSTPLYSGDLTNKSVNMGWTRNASIFIRQDDPLPLTIDSMVMEVEIGR